MSRFPYFSPAELACKCGCGRGEDDMDARFMRRIVELRTKLDFPFIVSSAFRCPEYNARVSTTGMDGPHTTGHALDIRLYGVRAFKLLTIAGRYGMTGLGVSQKGPHESRFLHLDDLDDGRPWTWSY